MKKFLPFTSNIKALMINILHKISKKFILPYIDKFTYSYYFDQPFAKKPIANKEVYYSLALNAERNTYSIQDVDKLETQTGYAISRDWIKSLALHTQVVIKKSELNYAHGRVLYCVLAKYLEGLNKDKRINILETGTARGFSAMCMAKALDDFKFNGLIISIDILPHNYPILWNCVDDHVVGSQTRDNLLSKWKELSEKYVVFVQGFSKIILPKIGLNRINFAFLDGVHTFEEAMNEFNHISKFQKNNDVIIFDDYNEEEFPGIVKAVTIISKKGNYTINIIKNEKTKRNIAVAVRK